MSTIPTVRPVVERILAGELTRLRTEAEDVHTIEAGETVCFREAARQYHRRLVDGGFVGAFLFGLAAQNDSRIGRRRVHGDVVLAFLRPCAR